MDWSNSYGTPMAAAVLIVLAILALGGLTVAFQGSVHF